MTRGGRGRRLKDKYRRLHQERRRNYQEVTAGLSMAFILSIVILGGFGTKETEETYTVYPCSKLEKITKLHCYNQTIMNEGSPLILAGIIYDPENNAKLIRNWITEIDPEYWKCTNKESFLNSVADYGPTTENGETVVKWNKLKVLNQTHVLLQGQKLNNTAAKNISIKNFDLVWWSYSYGKTISTLDWNCETGKAEINTLKALVGKTRRKLEITNGMTETEEVESIKSGPMKPAALRLGPKPIDRWIRMSEFQDRTLIHSIHEKEPIIPAENTDWINCYKKSRATPMCDKVPGCPWIGKMLWPSNKDRSTIDHKKQCAHKIDQNKKVWYCVIKAEAPWNQTLMERYENETISMWHEWIIKNYNFTLGTGGELDRITWTIKATLEEKKRSRGNYRHPYTLEYFPNSGIPELLLNLSGIAEYLRTEVVDQQYRSALLLYMLQGGEALKHYTVSKRTNGYVRYHGRHQDIRDVVTGRKEANLIWPVHMKYLGSHQIAKSYKKQSIGQWESGYYLKIDDPSSYSWGSKSKIYIRPTKGIFTKKWNVTDWYGGPCTRRHQIEIVKSLKGKRVAYKLKCLKEFDLGTEALMVGEREDNKKVEFWSDRIETTYPCNAELFNRWQYATFSAPIMQSYAAMTRNKSIDRNYMSCNYEAMEGTQWTKENLKITPLIWKQMTGETQIRKICAMIPYINYESEWKELLHPVDDYLELESIGAHWIHRIDFWTKTRNPSDVTLIKLIGKVVKRAFEDMGGKIKEVAEKVWNVIIDTWGILKIVLYCVGGIIVTIVIAIILVKLLNICIHCRQLRQIVNKAKYRRIALSADFSESENDSEAEGEGLITNLKV